MKDLYIAIKAQILAICPEILQVSVWNNQFDNMDQQNERAIPFPCVFVEFVNPNDVVQLGNGVQLFDPLIVRIHLGHDFYNGENQEENLGVFDLKQRLFSSLQKFEPDGAVAFIRQSETQDFDHSNMYHFIQDYQTNYIDNQQIEPVDGVPATGSFDIELDVTLE